MRKKCTIKGIIALCLMLIISLGVFYALDYYQFKLESTKSEEITRLVSYTKEINKYWREGDHKGRLRKEQLSCFNFNLKKINESALRCNPEFLSCILKDSKNTHFKIGGLEKVKGKYKLELLSRESPSSKWIINLENNCHEVFLPKREYAFGKFNRKKIHKRWIWDNLNQNIFIDQFMITNQQAIIWSKSHNIKLYEKLKSLIVDRGRTGEYYAPVTSLTYQEMEYYCADHRKQVLSSVVYDAATFLPENLEKKFPIVHIHSGYPWARKKTFSFLEKIKKNSNYKLTKADCKRVYSFDCSSKFTQKSFDTDSTSWMGLFQILGGELEVTRNPIMKRLNLKASSKYFNAKSRWHELGARAFWNGEAFMNKDFNWRLDDPDIPKLTTFGVGFRCMREVEIND